MTQDYDYKTVGLKPETHERLRGFKKHGISFDALVQEMIDQFDVEKADY